METFIDAIRKHPCLWNPLHNDYREMQVKDNAWHKVVDACNSKSIPNVHIAKIEWRRLRDNHRDALRRAKLGKNKLLPAQITTWKYARAMQFLEPHMKYRITEKIEMEPLESNGSKQSEHDVSTSEMPATKESSHKRRRIDHSSAQSSSRKDYDALESFFNCILHSTREMPQWMQTQVKKKIFAVIIEAEEQLSTEEQLYSNQTQCIEVEPIIKSEVVTEESSDIGYV